MFAVLLWAGVVAKEWAVLIAGSNGYNNYRHQADVCHAYHVMRRHGIPDERIIVFQYDDIANSSSNPYKGKIFNKPTAAGVPGVDVYAGCRKDYTGRDVTPGNFVGALTGDSTHAGGKKVLASTAEDNVFVFFSDHGGTGIIAFPSAHLSASALHNALQTMKNKKMFKKLVFYLEACESGSMFAGLVDPASGIYVTTASGPDEPSSGTYCPPHDQINGKDMNTCLGDLYSVNWMENADIAPATETLQQQYQIIKTKTSKSTVMQYGDRHFTSDPISNFIGDVHKSNYTETAQVSTPNLAGIVNSRDIPMHLAYYKYLRADKSDFSARLALAEELQKQVSRRVEADLVFMKLAKVAGDESLFFAAAKRPAVCGECCASINRVYQEHCGGYDDYSLQYMRVVSNVCYSVSGLLHGTTKVAESLKDLCKG